MSVKCGEETFLNIYVPSGSTNKRERWEMFNELATLLLARGRDQLPVMLGDWNCILAEIDTTNNFKANSAQNCSNPGIQRLFPPAVSPNS